MTRWIDADVLFERLREWRDDKADSGSFGPGTFASFDLLIDELEAQHPPEQPDGDTPIGPAFPSWQAYAEALEAEQEEDAERSLKLMDKILVLEKEIERLRINDAHAWLEALKERAKEKGKGI